MKENKVIMAALKSLVSLSSQAALLFLLIALAMQTKTAEAQSCPGLDNLSSCQAFLVPGAANPNTAAVMHFEECSLIASATLSGSLKAFRLNAISLPSLVVRFYVLFLEKYSLSLCICSTLCFTNRSLPHYAKLVLRVIFIAMLSQCTTL